MRLKSIIKLVLFSYIALGISTANAVTLHDQFKRIHDRVAGVHPDAATLSAMESACTGADSSVDTGVSSTWSSACYIAAANVALEHPDFYNVTLKNMATPWTNEAQSVFEDLNDYSATVIGMVRDDVDFRQLLIGDILYIVGNGSSYPTVSLPPGGLNIKTSNIHYSNAEANHVNLKATLQYVNQSHPNALDIPPEATAGIMSTRAGAKAFYIDGTNRAMFRFTILNHFCNDLEFYKDVTGATDRIRQDVSRSPGGDSRIYLNNCVGCHAGMDAMAGAFAHYQYDYSATGNPDDGELVYTAGSVQPKHLINADNFKWGYETTNHSWINYWREGPNSNPAVGWDTNNLGLTGAGNGASSLGEELANSHAFATCQVKKVFKTVCLRNPVDSTDQSKISAMTTSFKTNQYKLKQVFAEAAEYCVVPTP